MKIKSDRRTFLKLWTGAGMLAFGGVAAVLDQVRRGPAVGRDEKLARLTVREEQILTLVASGKTNGQIAKEIFLSEKTVKNHVSTILGKLEVARRTEATAYLVRHTVQTT